MVRINDLNNFIEVSTCPSLSLAAKKMEITQPALSESIGRLEKDLRTKLFYRTKNGISLTPNGQKILEKAKSIQGLILKLGTHESENFPTIVLGCHTAICSYFLPSLFSKLGSTIPNYKIQLKNDLSRNIQMEVQAGKIDIGIIVNPTSNPDLVLKKIADDIVCVWKSRKKSPQPQILADLNLFQVQSILKKWTTSPRLLFSTESLELIVRLTSEGCGYGIIPKRTVDLLSLDLIPVPNTPIFNDQFYIVHRPEFGNTKYEKDILSGIISSF